MIIITSPPERFSGEIFVQGDKAITHRAILLGALSSGITDIRGFPDTEDVRYNLNCMRSLGVKINLKGNRLIIEGRNKKFNRPAGDLDAGSSGTTARLLPGILAGQDFKATVTGDSSLQKYLIQDIRRPLQLMGAGFEGENDFLPVTIRGGDLQPISYRSPRVNAEVKAAILLAGLYARGTTTFEEPYQSSNHTELMLTRFGASVREEDCRVKLQGGTALKGVQVRIPGDISAAAFFMVAGSVVSDSEVLLRNIGLNPTRKGIIDLLLEMGADLELQQKRFWGKEPVTDIMIRANTKLKGFHVGGDRLYRLADDIPALMVAASLAEGKTSITGLKELQVNESDRIHNLAGQLKKLGVKIEATGEGIFIEGGTGLQGAEVDCCGDYLVAMALAVAGLAAEGETAVHGAGVIYRFFPGFMQALRSLIMK